MWNILKNRIRQGFRTMEYTGAETPLPERFRGRPELDASKCSDGCSDCEKSCPTQAIDVRNGGLKLDLGRCLFCTACMTACPEKAIQYTTDHRMAVRRREDLVMDGSSHGSGGSAGELLLAGELDQKMKSLFGRSLKLRHVAAGDCSGCAVELQALNNVVFDIGRFGIQFVASPRHADGILITGPVTENMKLALRKTYDAVPSPKLVIAVGACAISGGPFRESGEVHDGVPRDIPVDLYIPGCPPHPLTILDGFLRMLGRLELKATANKG